MNVTWLSQRTGLKPRQLRYAFERGLLTKPFASKKSLYCEYDWFRAIDTESKAYWLGFLYADGCVTDRGCIQVLLAAHEMDQLAKLKAALNAEHPIELRRDWIEDEIYPRWQETAKIRLNSREMADDLARLGMLPRKSLTLVFPTEQQVPLHLRRHFIRGYFDGDGSVSVSYYRGADKAGHWTACILGTTSFVQRCGEVIMEEGDLSQIDIRPHSSTPGMDYLQYRRVADLTRLRDYLYQDATVWLERKRETFDKLPTRYHSNKRSEIVSTIRERASELGETFTSQTLGSLYGTGRDTAWATIRTLLTDGVLVQAGSVGSYDLYRLT